MKKFFRYLLILLGSLVLLTFIFWKPIKSYLQGKIQERLLEFINTSDERPYDYDVGKIEISIIGGTTILTEVKIVPRDGMREALKSGQKGMLIEADVDSVAIQGIGLYNLFMLDAIHVQRILVGDVNFKMLTNSAFDRPDSVARKPFVLKDVFSDKLRKAYIRTVELRDINVFTDDIHTPEPFAVKFDSARFLLKEIYTDEKVIQGVQPFTYQSLEMSARKFQSTFVKGHTILVDAFHLNTLTEEIILDGASFGPTDYNFKDLSKQFIRSINVISAQRVKLHKINFQSWQADGGLKVRKLEVTKPEILVSMDHRWPKPKFERVYLQDRIRSIPFPVEIDSVIASGGFVHYREIFNDGKPPLILTFSDISASFLNITNDRNLWKQDPVLRFNASSKFLDSGSLSVDVDYTMTDTMNPFHMVLSLDNMSMTTLNPILEGQVNAKLDGYMDKMAMDIAANKKGAEGEFVFDYSGLKITVYKLKETKHGVKVKKNWLINTVANPVLRSNNHYGEPNFRTGIVDYDRPPDISFFGLVWQCIKDGMVSTLIPGKSAEKLEKKQEKAQKKAEKEAEKAERKQEKKDK